LRRAKHNHAGQYHPRRQELPCCACALQDILDDPVTAAAERTATLFDGCTITRHEGSPHDVPQLDWNALFPNGRME
jgi:hypothetical protein